MKVISTNIGNPTAIKWNGRTIKTGIYKYPIEGSIVLQKEEVENDTIIDRKNHGGIYKACYLFSTDNYDFWKDKYPNLDWDWGMFGENLSINSLDESQIRIGDIYKLGSALVQVTQPREPCFKLGIRFKNQEVLKQFIEHEKPGVYVKVLKEGSVSCGDFLELKEQSTNTLTVKQFYQLLYMRKKDSDLVKLAISNKALPLYKREYLEKFL
ncbi:MOSC domain-containing protein [uncultured Croceitalea sp.]|uniref:MOSC domain-containing protein n=1 Tax=uncultured Croceitalea sp. TaxID=1798908 RepID=UPI00374F5E60